MTHLVQPVLDELTVDRSVDRATVPSPGADWALFTELMLPWEMRSHRWAQQQARVVLFDRGVPDVVGYLRLAGLPSPAHVFAATECFRYHRQVLISPPWPVDLQRQRAHTGLAEAERTYDAMAEIYTELGYEVIDLSRTDVATRSELVTARITSGQTDDTAAAR